MAKSEHEGSGLGSFLVGLVLGTLAGIIAALWYAPQSGKATRDELQQRVEGESISQSMEEGKAEARRFRQNMSR